MTNITVTFSPSISPTHDGCQATMACFARVAFVATVLKSEWGTFVCATILKGNRSIGIFFLQYLEKPFLPDCYLLQRKAIHLAAFSGDSALIFWRMKGAVAKALSPFYSPVVLSSH